MTSSRIALIALSALAFAAASASATPLTAGGDVPASSVPPVAGAIIDSGGTSYITSPTGAITGQYTFTVFKESAADNPLGGLTFVYTVSSNASSTHAIEVVAVSGFGPWQTDVSESGPVSPDNISRTLSGNINFNFVPTAALNPGSATGELIVRTNAPSFKQNFLNVSNSETATVLADGPAAPEPASLAILGLGGAMLLRRRR